MLRSWVVKVRGVETSWRERGQRARSMAGKAERIGCGEPRETGPGRTARAWLGVGRRSACRSDGPRPASLIGLVVARHFADNTKDRNFLSHGIIRADASSVAAGTSPLAQVGAKADAADGATNEGTSAAQTYVTTGDLSRANLTPRLREQTSSCTSWSNVPVRICPKTG